MIENISKKQEKIQEKIQKQQELNDDKSRELTDEELDQIVGGMKAVHGVQTAQVAKVTGALATTDDLVATFQLATAQLATVPHWGPDGD